MKKFIINSVVINEYYQHYAGDSNHTLSLNFAHNGVLYLMLNGDRNNILPITSCMEYIEWLLLWSDSLMDMPKEQWWNDRTNKGSRYEEFYSIIDKLNKEYIDKNLEIIN